MRPVIKRVLLLLLLVMAIVLIVGAGINYFTSTENGDPNKDQPTSGQSTQGSTQGPTSPEQAQTTVAQPTTPSTKAGSNAPAPTTGISVAKSNSELADSGPGSTAAVFVVASLIGYTIYRRVLLRRSLN